MSGNGSTTRRSCYADTGRKANTEVAVYSAKLGVLILPSSDVRAIQRRCAIAPSFRRWISRRPSATSTTSPRSRARYSSVSARISTASRDGAGRTRGRRPDEDIRKVIGGNLLRIMRTNEAISNK